MRCPVDGCRRGVQAHQAVCWFHWGHLAPALRDMLTRLRNGGRPLDGYDDAVANAISQLNEQRAATRRR